MEPTVVATSLSTIKSDAKLCQAYASIKKCKEIV